MTKIDLHMHSIYSLDGEYTPEMLIAAAKNAGLEAIALTDHNTTAGIRKAIEAGKAEKMEIIPGIELDCIFNKKVFHVLGYYIDYTSDKLCKLDCDVRTQEIAAAKTRIKLVRDMGIEIDEEEVFANAKDGFVTGEIIAELVLSKSDSLNNPLLKPYFSGGSRSDNPYVNFYWDYCAQGKPAYVHIEYISMLEAVTFIKEIGGVPILAHPGINLRGNLKMLGDVIRLGIEGIEAYSSYHTQQQCRYFAEKAKGYKVIVTGGSDFHGKNKPSIHIGNFGYNEDGLDVISRLKERRFSC